MRTEKHQSQDTATAESSTQGGGAAPSATHAHGARERDHGSARPTASHARRGFVLVFVSVSLAAGILTWIVAQNASGTLAYTVLAVGLGAALAGGSVAAWTSQRRDEDDRRRLLALERRIAELEKTTAAAPAGNSGSERVSTMLATMSHELRTPLTAILGFTDLLLDPNDDVTVLRSHAQTIRRNCQHLLNVLNDVLDISRLDAGMIRIERKPCDPVQVVREIVDLLEPRAREKHLELEFDVAPGLPASVAMDVFRVRQVLLNLVGNAVKFTEDGGVTVRISYVPSKSEIRFDVIDSGPGIADEHKDLVFAPFHRGAGAAGGRSKGTGLGLAISKRLADRMGGDVELSTRLGYGSTFTFRIPAEHVTVPAGTGTTPAREDLEPWLPRPSWRILVVEDALEHQKLMYSCLRRAGHHVEVCDNGPRGLHRAREAAYLREPYTVILLDAHLEGQDGPTTAVQLRQHGFRGPILAVTADSTPEMRERCLAAGCDEVYVKPIERASLLTTIADLVRGAAPADVA